MHIELLNFIMDNEDDLYDELDEIQDYILEFHIVE